LAVVRRDGRVELDEPAMMGFRPVGLLPKELSPQIGLKDPEEIEDMADCGLDVRLVFHLSYLFFWSPPHFGTATFLKQLTITADIIALKTILVKGFGS